MTLIVLQGFGSRTFVTQGYAPGAAPPSPPPPPPIPPGTPPFVVVGPATVDEDTLEAVRILWVSAGDVTPLPVVDEETLEAIRILWSQDNVQLPQLFTVPPQTGRLKSPQTLPYVYVTSELESRNKIAAARALNGWNDYRKVTMEIRGTKAQVVQAAGAIQAVFNNSTVLAYPSGNPFIRWEPVGDLVLKEDETVKDGFDIWLGVLVAKVWSVRVV